jgi:acetoin utilization deacetylase AcuC-like enzyme
VRYTTGSLCAALDGALRNPAQITHSPTGGFHHAQPWGGGGFCTFSGQVIASLRAYRRQGARGAWIDLDGHFGNSIEDSRKFAPDLDLAIPKGFNINPIGRGQTYLQDLQGKLDHVGAAIMAGKLDYVAFAHGADSHEWDALSGQLSTREWVEASSRVYRMIEECSRTLGRPVPLVTTLFGGYRDDDPKSVLELHAADLSVALGTLCGVDTGPFIPTVTRPQGPRGH